MRAPGFYMLFLPLVLAGSKRAMKDIVRTLKFGNCDDSYVEKAEMSHFVNITITNVGKGLNVFNGQFLHKRDVDAIYAVYTMYKCETPNGANCELMFNNKFDDYCGILERPGEYWSPLWSSFHPKAKCPLYKGTYQIINGTIDADRLLAYGKKLGDVRDYFWITKTHMHTTDTKENFACMSMILQIAQIRV